MRSLIIAIAHQILFRLSIKKNEMGRACSRYVGEVYTGFWWGNLRERDHLEDAGVDWRITVIWIFRK